MKKSMTVIIIILILVSCARKREVPSAPSLSPTATAGVMYDVRMSGNQAYNASDELMRICTIEYDITGKIITSSCSNTNNVMTFREVWYYDDQCKLERYEYGNQLFLYTYDTDGKLNVQTYYDAVTGGTEIGHKVFLYDASGGLIGAEIYNSSNVLQNNETFGIDTAGRVTTVASYVSSVYSGYTQYVRNTIGMITESLYCDPDGNPCATMLNYTMNTKGFPVRVDGDVLTPYDYITISYEQGVSCMDISTIFMDIY